MKRFVVGVLLASAVLLVPISPVYAGWVQGHTKSDGTYVNGYWRSDPNGLKYDNYSFDGDWSDAYNDSYYSSSKSYSSDWYTPSWFTQDDYWVGKSFYDSRNSYTNYSYNSYDYDYNFWDDPIYDYSPSYNYDWGWDNDYDSSLYDSYDSYNSYDSYDYYNSYDSYDSCSYSYYC